MNSLLSGFCDRLRNCTVHDGPLARECPAQEWGRDEGSVRPSRTNSRGTSRISWTVSLMVVDGQGRDGDKVGPFAKPHGEETVASWR